MKWLSSVILILSLQANTAFSQDVGMPTYALDHLILFCTDHSIQNTVDEVFTRGEMLKTKHISQGTMGEYYLFLNSFLELLYLDNDSLAKINENRFRSNYTERWKSGGLGIGFGLKMNPYDTANIVFDHEIYYSADNRKEEYYVMFNHNKDSMEPMAFLTVPEREHKVLDSITAVRGKVDSAIEEDLIKYLTHRTGVLRITGITLKLRKDQMQWKCLPLLRSTENFTIIASDEFQLIVEFDHHHQNSSLQVTDQLKFLY